MRCPRTTTAWLLLVAAWSIQLCPTPALAAPHRPTDDGEVLEHLSDAPADPKARRLRALRQALAQRPTDVDVALRVAQAYVERGRSQSDPRYYGYAQAALTPWWTLADPPAAVLVLRATIRQHNHQFEAALADLSRALRSDPDNAQAWWTRAIVLQVRGEYAEARRSCLEVLQRANPLIAASCLGSVDSLSGAAESAYDLLRNVLAKSPTADSDARAWALTTLAEIAARIGKTEAADGYFHQALTAAGDDPYLLGAYADFLLDTDRPAVARDLLRGRASADALLLRLALAEAKMSAPDATRHIDMLRERFAAARLRGDTAHGREEARLALHLLRQPQVAVQLASENWSVQREPADARILLEAAHATGDRAAARPVLDFLARNGTEDVTLRRLSAAIEAIPP